MRVNWTNLVAWTCVALGCTGFWAAIVHMLTRH